MIPKKIQALFDFIDFLNKNKREYIEKYIPLCNELKILFNQREELNSNSNYIDKQESDKIQVQISEKFSPITLNIYNPITNKLRELEIWSGDDTYSSIWNNNSSAIFDFKENFKTEDVSQIMKYKQKYLSFRRETNTDFLCLTFVFHYLDEILKELFSFFKDTTENEFDSFETKTIEVNNLSEAIKSFMENKVKNVKFSIPSKTVYNNYNEKQIQNSTTNIKNELIMGDKFQVGDIPNNKGQVIIGNENKTNVSDKDNSTQKSFKWQKTSVIITTVLAIITIVLMIILL
jgi:hypothetical protein